MNCMKCLAACASVAFGLISLAEAADAKPKIRVLVVTGGHGFKVKTFYGMFDAMPDVEYGKLELPKGADELKPGLEKRYDVLVFYLCPGHGPTQYNHPTYRELVARGIRWAAGRLD